jgi:hypothetical protein
MFLLRAMLRLLLNIYGPSNTKITLAYTPSRLMREEPVFIAKTSHAYYRAATQHLLTSQPIQHPYLSLGT